MTVILMIAIWLPFIQQLVEQNPAISQLWLVKALFNQFKHFGLIKLRKNAQLILMQPCAVKLNLACYLAMEVLCLFHIKLLVINYLLKLVFNQLIQV